MRIGLIADTHIPEVAEKIPSEIIESFRGVDLILHAGDVYSPSVLDDLECIAPVIVARGDDDDGDIRLDKRVKERQVLELEGQKILVVHERPFTLRFPEKPFSLMFPPWQNKVAAQHGKNGLPDIYVFGHEHHPVVQHVDNILFINPGSPTFLDYHRGLGTIAILDINFGKADVHIVQL
jgi:uncharacterized protein